MVLFSGSGMFTSTDEQTLVVVPDPYIAFLKRLCITNQSASTATVMVRFYNAIVGKPVLVINVEAGKSVTLSEEYLPKEAAPTAISVTSTQQPYTVDWSIELV